jgi:cell division septum initiation protein DivIVA
MDMTNHFFMLWVRCLPDSQTRADVTSEQEQRGDEVERLREEIAGLEEEVEDMKRKASETQRELEMQVQGAEESISSLTKEVEDARSALAEEKEQRGDEVERLREEIAGLEEEVEDMKSISALTKEVEGKMNFVHSYIITKQKSFAFRRLRVSFLLWCDRLVRRRLIEEWTIHIYAKKRLRRIEKNACTQYLQRLLARGFRRIGHWVHEKRKFHQKIGELRSDFACASVLLPASPLRAGELRVFCLAVGRGPHTASKKAPFSVRIAAWQSIAYFI